MDDRQVLRDVAAGQRQIVFCILGQFGIGILEGVVVAGHPTLFIINLFLGLAVLVFMIISVLKLAGALGQSQIMYVILMFIPCISLIMLLVLNRQATKRLQQAGIKVGLLGADPNAI
jgi:hypothetical protein